MQTDMHYYGTYAMARAAGLAVPACTAIATYAEFVDDNAAKRTLRFRDGARLDLNATAHHSADVRNIDLDDQRQIWVPFHFLPGNEGESYTERLACRMDGEIARAMVARNLDRLEAPYGLELLGITAHVYADTFSHYGFSGISSRHNRVLEDSFELHDLEPEIERYVRGKADRFREAYRNEMGLLANVKSWFAEQLSGALGHGAVLTFPDRPYLEWSFEYEHPEPRRERRSNPRTFLAGCEALHGMFARAAERRPGWRERDAVPFDRIRDRVEGILRTQGRKSERIAVWQAAAESGDLFAGAGERIPGYEAGHLHDQMHALDGTEDSGTALERPVYRFFQAASDHRQHVLRELLPGHGLAVA